MVYWGASSFSARTACSSDHRQGQRRESGATHFLAAVLFQSVFSLRSDSVVCSTVVRSSPTPLPIAVRKAGSIVCVWLSGPSSAVVVASAVVHRDIDLSWKYRGKGNKALLIIFSLASFFSWRDFYVQSWSLFSELNSTIFFFASPSSSLAGLQRRSL